MEDKKKEGNEAFAAGNYQLAYDLYSDVLKVDPDNVSIATTILSNRAAALIKLGKYEDAIKDATKSLDLNSEGTIAVKTLRRRAQCFGSLEQWEEAVRDYQKACDMDPSDDDLRSSLRNAKLELKKSKRKDYYKILGVPKSADQTEIKKAYRLLALKWHPDKNNADEESKAKADKMFKDIGEAYSALSDPQKKARYDAGQDLDDDSGMGGAGSKSIFLVFFYFPLLPLRSRNLHFLFRHGLIIVVIFFSNIIRY